MAYQVIAKNPTWEYDDASTLRGATGGILTRVTRIRGDSAGGFTNITYDQIYVNCRKVSNHNITGELSKTYWEQTSRNISD